LQSPQPMAFLKLGTERIEAEMRKPHDIRERYRREQFKAVFKAIFPDVGDAGALRDFLC
jgi:hypothetical protein